MAVNQGGLYPAEDCVSAVLSFPGDVLGTGIWCFTTHDGRSADMNEIVGSRGSLRFSTFGTEPIELHTGAGLTLHKTQTPAHIQQPLIQTVVDDLNGVAQCPSTGESALRTTEVMDAILHDWRARQEP